MALVDREAKHVAKRTAQKEETTPEQAGEPKNYEGLSIHEIIQRQTDEGDVQDIAVHSPFTLSLTHDDVRKFGVGIHRNVPQAIADHWYVKHHVTSDGQMPQAAPVEPETPANLLIEAHRLASEERDRWRDEAQSARTRAEQAESQVEILQGRVQQLEEEARNRASGE